MLQQRAGDMTRLAYRSWEFGTSVACLQNEGRPGQRALGSEKNGLRGVPYVPGHPVQELSDAAAR
jgi:hypothetical protein